MLEFLFGRRRRAKQTGNQPPSKDQLTAGEDRIDYPTTEEAWTRLLRFPLDRPDASRPFSTRLAEKTGWDAVKTTLVIDEYRKFLLLAYLAVRNGTIVVPAHDVDEAWHLHLQDTQSYWEELCSDTLRVAIHHMPSEGRTGEDAKYAALYADTMIRYWKQFGHNPPENIWGRMPEIPAPQPPTAPPASKKKASGRSSGSSSGSSATDAGSAAFIPTTFGGCATGSSGASAGCGGGGGGCGGGGGGCGGGGGGCGACG